MNEPAYIKADHALSGALAWVRWRLARLIPEPESANSYEPTSEAAAPAECAILCDLARRFGLSNFELEMITLCAAAELDASIPACCGMVQGSPEKAYPTLALGFAAFDDASWDAVGPQSPLRYWRLIEVETLDTAGLLNGRLRIAERLLHFLRGLDCVEEALLPYVTPVRAAFFGEPLPSHLEVAASLRGLAADTTPLVRRVVELRSTDAHTSIALAAWVARATGRRLMYLNVEDLPSEAAESGVASRLWERESALQPLLLFLGTRHPQAQDMPASVVGAMRFYLTRTQALVFTDVPQSAELEGRLLLDVPPIARSEQRAVWQSLLGSGSEDLAPRLSSVFDFPLGAIVDIATRVAARADPADPSGPWQACTARVRERFGRLAERLSASAAWDDLVLPPAQMGLVRRIAEQVKHRNTVYEEWGFRSACSRGLATIALFCGESGTGKTMAAEVIANELGVDLYRIDLSAVVSKYIGETEKNIRAVFDAAEYGGTILFFDEADALYGRRTEVKDSHDRYANIETSYLLQRMESYRGLSILATNRKQALDPAFLRRLRFVVNFPHPTTHASRAIWARVFPAAAPLGVLDLDRLATLNLTGGSIRSVAINAAFLAAQANVLIDTGLVLAAAADEYRKLGRSTLNDD